MIHSNLSKAYNAKNPRITHFYNNIDYSGVPIWSLFEILALGDFGFLLSCLNYDVRNNISQKIGINTASDTNRELIYTYIYALKDLRNAIAHNSVVFDTRFRNISPTKAMKRCLEQEIGLPYVNFKSIGDYVILMCYFLKLLGSTKTEIRNFIRDFEKITNEYRKLVAPSVASIVIHSELPSRLDILKKSI